MSEPALWTITSVPLPRLIESLPAPPLSVTVAPSLIIVSFKSLPVNALPLMLLPNENA